MTNEEKVKRYINSVKESLKVFYGGKVPPQFSAQILQLKDFYSAYLQAADEFHKNSEES